ncbi:uncharacterized protein PV06_00446 [Exophiala oligosperma]|uniref:Xylanolytic transcriptional activator regulatory domain-containing protein n=1 Tax=Exophiala oligosperma TaxID=215243 RepID=A0A0D2EIL5_9EURO|nr:uncharacterized protein PV06_00446 [Exophiala oligosperma]KIW47784.1 hypothetical protein PV06_00446 [Exophiala oligosperma]
MLARCRQSIDRGKHATYATNERPHERKRPKYLSNNRRGSSSRQTAASIHDATIQDEPTILTDHIRSDNESLEGSPQTFGHANPTSFPISPQRLVSNTGTPLATYSEVSPRRILPVPEYVATTESHVGRSDYLGDGDVRFREEMVTVGSRPSRLSDTDLELLQAQKALEMPQRSVRASLVDSYVQYCSVWTPIVDTSLLERLQGNEASPLLLNALFLAGSRVSLSKTLLTMAEEFYRKARLLFMLGHEIDTLTSIIAVTLIQWYNPTGPEHISTSTSGFWIRIAAGMAYQVGLHREPVAQKDKELRRRLWWSIVSRDDIISIGTGRPRTINFADSDVSPPTVLDFAVQGAKARLFVAFSRIIRLLADLTEHIRRKTLTRTTRTNLENALYRWAKELPDELRLFHGSPKRLRAYNFEARQLLAPYFVTIVILARHEAYRNQSACASFVASSFVVGIFEDFLHRGELCHCGPVFTFYGFAAGLAQIPALQYRSLAPTAKESLSIIRSSLVELKGRWGSAVGALAALEEMQRLTERHPFIGDAPEQQSRDLMTFFDDFGPEICKQHFLLGQTFDPTETNFPPSHPDTNFNPRQLQQDHDDMESSVNMLDQNHRFDLHSAESMLLPHGDLFFDDLDPAGSWMEDLGLGLPSY